jgi:cell division transport system permease protein
MKRQWTTLLRILRYGFHNFMRNAWLSTAASIVMVVTLLIILTTFSARMVFGDTIQQVRDKIDVSVYLVDTITDDQTKKLTEELKNVPVVTTVDYISKEDARKAFEKQGNTEFSDLQALGELEDNPFPASLRVKTSDPNKLEELNQVINKDENKLLQSAPASYSGERKDAINKIAQVSQFMEVGGLFAAGIFVVISIMIIFNTIRMAIFNRKDEIEMMKLIGAEKSFIRGPFIIEAALYGILAALVSVILMYAIIFGQADNLAKGEVVVAPTVAFFKQWPVLILLAQMLVGVIIGVFSSLLAMRRYLKL